jgi:hypothetical protein
MRCHGHRSWRLTACSITGDAVLTMDLNSLLGFLRGNRVLGQVSDSERQLIGMHVRRLLPILHQPLDGFRVVRMQVSQQHRRLPGSGPKHRLSRGSDRPLAARPASVYQYPGQPSADNSPHTPRGSADLLTWCARRLHEHEGYVIEHLEDLPDIKNWTLSPQPPTH